MRAAMTNSFIQNRNGARLGGALLAFGLTLAAWQPATATDRRFTYSYEPETMVAGAMEVEQWMTLRAGRKELVGGVNDLQNFNRWDLRTELEYGVTDNYQMALYLNATHESFRDSMGSDVSEFKFTGVSLENIYNVINPANHAVGVSLYLEPGYSGDEAEIETKIIIGQRHGEWKWTVNLNHEVEWEHNLHDLEGEFGVSLGVARNLGKHWALGLEVVNINKVPDYKEFESTAIYVGPVLSYRSEKWWAALTVLPQVFGRNWDGADDDARNLDLVHNERVNIRFIVGFDL